MNYVPSSGWWYSWVDWDETSIVGDLEAVAGLGADHIRIHCLWPLFQPNPGLVSARMLDHLARLLDRADDAGLDVVVTVFDGWLSGFAFQPAWVPDQLGVFRDEEVITAQLALLEAMATRIGGHRRFLGFDIANEPNVLAGISSDGITLEQGDGWVSRLLGHCERIAPGGLHNVGMDQAPWLTDGRPFSRHTLARTGAITPVHSWIYFTGALQRYGETGVGTLHLAEYLLELAKAFHTDPLRSVWLQEYGASTQWLPDPATFLEAATRAALDVTGLWGLTWWCSHDISRTLGGFDELEYDLGLLTVDNEVKPTGAAFRRLTETARGAAPPAPRKLALVLDDDRTPDLEFADTFFTLVAQGRRPTIVLRSRTTADALERRGITVLHNPA
ncbi:cellulase family glycosylhydrolase [Streptomyces sp. NPDC058739]|uniref:glycoside hydrolase 5 family protein n=1 Tax=Streptomyces sp. NPDC058739 TaxID=3346618 RepID=UPI003679B38B